MDFFTKGYSALRGDKGQHQSASDTIDRLCDRLANATLLEDRRAAVLSLKGLAKDYRNEVGARGLTILLKALEQDGLDVDTLRAILETLNIICSVEDEKEPLNDPGAIFTEEFVRDPNNVTLVLDALNQEDSYVRYSCVKLLSTLLKNKSQRLQECILISPMGISRLVGLLDDRREFIRNEGLLLLIALTTTNADIQKIVAFENAFERLFEIILEEEALDGGIVVQDCLELTVNLLRYNISNQNYFRETSCIQRLPGLFGLLGFNPLESNTRAPQFVEVPWPAQKIMNANLMLRLIKMLVVPNSTNTSINQNLMHQCGVLQSVTEMALSSNAPPVVKAEALYALADIVRAALVAVAVAPDYSNNPGLQARAAATYVLECQMIKNPDAQLALASTLTPPPEDNPNTDLAGRPFSAGSLVLNALVDWERSLKDPYICWFASVILSHVLRDNDQCKTIAAAITLGDPDHGEEPVPLVHAISASLMMASRDNAADLRVQIAYLSLLITWLFNSPSSVKQFLSEGVHVQFLIEQVNQSSVDPMIQGLSAFLLGVSYKFDDDPEAAFSRSQLQPILLSRVGADQFVSRISRLRENDAVKVSSSCLQISELDHEKYIATGALPPLFFDQAFLEFFKTTYDSIQRSISEDPNALRSAQTEASTAPASDTLLNDYKHALADKDGQIEKLKDIINGLEKKLAEEQSVKADYQARVEQLQLSLNTLLAKHSTLEKEQEDLLVCLAEQDLEMKQLKGRLKELGETIEEDEEEAVDENEE
ncbi:uncharacterized protein VTP21DRAFT_8407 [Calcarisporiella thermophila]|uniref:uncharacterized protein n=1 Tax=Calcarisporiella thermophila TaxID=911321 RepID=UPI0037425013